MSKHLNRRSVCGSEEVEGRRSKVEGCSRRSTTWYKYKYIVPGMFIPGMILELHRGIPRSRVLAFIIPHTPSTVHVCYSTLLCDAYQCAVRRMPNAYGAERINLRLHITVQIVVLVPGSE